MPTSTETHSERFTNKCAEATVGYAHAGFFAGLYAANAMLEAWAEACEEMKSDGNTSSKSWFKDPSASPLSSPMQSPFSVFDFWNTQAWMSDAWSPAFWSQAAMQQPLWTQMWPMMANSNAWSPFPFSASATVWPMTWSLMSLGLPHEVARPTAEANAAAYDAIESAQQIANESLEACKAVFDPEYNAEAPKSSADPNDPLALFKPWFPQPSVA